MHTTVPTIRPSATCRVKSEVQCPFSSAVCRDLHGCAGLFEVLVEGAGLGGCFIAVGAEFPGLFLSLGFHALTVASRIHLSRRYSIVLADAPCSAAISSRACDEAGGYFVYPVQLRRATGGCRRVDSASGFGVNSGCWPRVAGRFACWKSKAVHESKTNVHPSTAGAKIEGQIRLILRTPLDELHC